MYTVYHHIHHLYLVVHGGPGGGTSPAMARYFDPLVYKIVLVDQRGCGESLPFADLRENTTYDSVRDFEKIRVKLGMMMMILILIMIIMKRMLLLLLIMKMMVMMMLMVTIMYVYLTSISL